VSRWLILGVLVALAGCKRSEPDPACGTCDPNLDKATALRQTCDKGVALACHYLGRLYENGSAEVDKDLDEARTYYARACTGGYKPACEYADRVSKAK
jgi:hypothetical protein